MTGTEAREQTKHLRTLEDRKEARGYKQANFDYVTFSGVFNYGRDKGLIKHSGLICLDFDHLSDVAATKELLIADSYFPPQLLFTSPSGDGIKDVVGIDVERCDHRTWYKAIRNYMKCTYNLEVDQSCINVSRACYLPHDIEVYVSPDVCPF